MSPPRAGAAGAEGPPLRARRAAARRTIVKRAVLAAAAFAGGPAWAAVGTLDELLGWMQGDYDNMRQVEAQPPAGEAEAMFSRLGVMRRRVEVPALGEHVVYAQINRRADPGDVYRQRLFVFTPGADGQFVMETWSFTDAEAHADIAGRLEDLASLPPAAFEPSLPPGCEARWRRGDEVWIGRVDPDRCRIVSSRDGRPRGIGMTEFVSPDGLRNEESGYTENGRMIFGLPPGVYYEYDRVAPQ